MITEDGKVIFNEAEQAEVDRIIGERLARAKAEKPADYDDLKEIEKELEAFGYSGTPAEKKAAIKAYKAELEAQKELEILKEQAKNEGTSPELLKEIKELKKELEEIKGERQAQKQAVEQKKAADEAWNKQVKEMEEKYPDVDLDALAKDAKFLKFVKGKSGLTLSELYEDFIEFVGEAQAEALLKDKSKESRSTSSGKSQGSDGAKGLTDEEKRFIDENNRRYPKNKITYKEFLERKNR